MLSPAAVIRSATPADAESVTRVINAAYLVERFFVDGPRISSREVGDLLATGTFLLADDGGEIAACVYVEPRGESAYLGLLAVDPVRQGQGWGSRMLTAGEAYCTQRGCRAIDIKVVTLREELLPFYTRHGYVERGTEPFVDPRLTRPCAFLLMSKSLPQDPQTAPPLTDRGCER